MTIVGLDIGGSKTHALARSGDRLVEAYSGSANLSSVGEAEAARQLDAALAGLAGQGVGPISAICAGAAGVDSPEAERRLHRLIADRVPGAELRVVHDTELILAAAGVEHGIAVISGTGSVAWGRDAAGRTARAGGWGYLLGDEGSGYGIARGAVRHALDRADRGQGPDALGRGLAAACGLAHPGQLLDHFYAVTERRYWAGLAWVVFDLAAEGDPAAAGLIAAAGRDLAGLIQAVHLALDSPSDCPVVLGGGLLTHRPALVAAVRDALTGEGPRAGSTGDPLAGSTGDPEAGVAGDPLAGSAGMSQAGSAETPQAGSAAGQHDLRVLDTDPVHGALGLAARLVLAAR